MFEQEITDQLKKMIAKGIKQADIVRETGMSQSYLSAVIRGKQPIKNPTVDLLVKVFPRCHIELNGSHGSVGQVNGGTVYAGTGNNFFHNTKQAVDYDGMFKTVLGSDMSPETKCKIFSIMEENKIK